VIVMLDQNLTHELVPVLNTHGNEYDLEFIPFPVYPHHGALDPEVVRLAQCNNAVAILTGDKSDFAAKKLYFGLLLRAGVSAAVIREYHLEVTSPELQLARVIPHLQRVSNELRSASEPLQITFRKERMQVRGLQEILEEMEGRE
jgi:predicted nuclease of predicted toxin-antitoxin system